MERVGPIAATARFVDAEHALIVEPDEPTRSTNRLSVDSLTLVFTPPPHVWTGLDAYSNRALWRAAKLELPAVDIEGAVGALADFDRHGIGESRSADLSYSYSEQASLLLVRIAEGDVERRVRFLSCAVCGLGSDDEVVEIWLEDLAVEQ